MKSFEHWKWQELNLTFGLRRAKNHPLLTQWLSAKAPLTQREDETIKELLASLEEVADSYNEDELKFMFIGPLIALVSYRGDAYRAFTQRNLGAVIKDAKGQDIEMKGRVEFMVAYGLQDPLQPYFFFHEYKQEKKRENDPLGQVLASMLVGQHLNETPQPVYGCYVVGRLWFFVVLDGKDYAVSHAYDSAQQDVYDVFAALREAKNYIQTRAKGLTI